MLMPSLSRSDVAGAKHLLRRDVAGDKHLALCGGNDCEECPDLIPDNITLTLAGLGIVGCCTNGVSQSRYWGATEPDVNGVYGLSSNNGDLVSACGSDEPCGFAYREPLFGVLKKWGVLNGDTTCSIGAVIDEDEDLVVRARFYDDGGGVRLYVQVVFQQSTASPMYVLFRGQTDVLTNCADADGAVIANDAPGCPTDDTVADVFKCWNASLAELYSGLGDGAGTITVTM